MNVKDTPVTVTDDDDDKVTAITTKDELREFSAAMQPSDWREKQAAQEKKDALLDTDDGLIHEDAKYRRIADEHWNDNEVAHLMRAGYTVTVLCIHGDNSDYVRLNGMGYNGWCYGISFPLDWDNKHGDRSKEGKVARYDMFLQSLAQHGSDAIALQWDDDDGKRQLTVFNRMAGQRSPSQYEMMELKYSK